MRRFDLGDAVPLRYVGTDDEDQPIEVSGTFTLTKPDETTYEGTPQSGGTGILEVTIPAAQVTQKGRYGYVWSVSGDITDVKRGRFYVDDIDDEMPPLASMAMFGLKLGYDPEESELARAEQLLDAASEEIRDEAGKTWVTASGALDMVPRRIARICVEAAFRAFTNPEGLSQRSIGDSSKSFDRSGREGGEIVYLTDAERRAVRKAAGVSSFVSMTMYAGVPDATVDPWDAVTAE
jgi:hypothetical protein